MFDFMFLFSGLLIRYEDIPRAWIFMYRMGSIPKALNAAGIDQLYCRRGDDLDSSSLPLRCQQFPVQRGDSVILQTPSEYAMDYLSSDESDVWPQVGWLVLSVAVVRLLVCLTMHVKVQWSTRKRE